MYGCLCRPRPWEGAEQQAASGGSNVSFILQTIILPNKETRFYLPFGKTTLPVAWGETHGGRRTGWVRMKGCTDLGSEKLTRFRPSRGAKELKTMGHKKNIYKARKLAVGTKWMWKDSKKEGTRTVLRFLSWKQVNCGTICRYRE